MSIHSMTYLSLRKWVKEETYFCIGFLEYEIATNKYLNSHGRGIRINIKIGLPFEIILQLLILMGHFAISLPKKNTQ